VPRSAFLEGARKAGGTKTCTGAIAKQKTAAPQGAASLSLAVLESDGRKRKWRSTSVARWSQERRIKQHGTRVGCPSVIAGDWGRGQVHAHRVVQQSSG
jgi:hypothetical protein